MTDIAMENGHLQWICPLTIVIFHHYVTLPEGKCDCNTVTKWDATRSGNTTCKTWLLEGRCSS